MLLCISGLLYYDALQLQLPLQMQMQVQPQGRGKGKRHNVLFLVSVLVISLDGTPVVARARWDDDGDDGMDADGFCIEKVCVCCTLQHTPRFG